MKWNFEFASERRDYLHKYSVARRNGFCSSLNHASFKDRAKLAVRRSPDPKPITFPDDSTNETIVARELESSVSHFIDCSRAARRLCASPGQLPGTPAFKRREPLQNGESHEHGRSM